MKRVLQRFLLLMLVALCCLTLPACTPDPPSVESVEICFENNYNDLQTVVEFLANSDYDSIIIQESNGTMWADFSTVTIEDEDVCKAIERLLGSHGVYDHMSKNRNTIELEQWQGFIVEIWSGIAYSINGIDTPNVEFATELVPLSRAGWYYFVSDYNEWRTGKRP